MSRRPGGASRHHTPARRGLAGGPAPRGAALQAFGLASNLHAAVFLHALEERGQIVQAGQVDLLAMRPGQHHVEIGVGHAGVGAHQVGLAGQLGVELREQRRAAWTRWRPVPSVRLPRTGSASARTSEKVLCRSELMKPSQRRSAARALPSPISLLCGACSARYSRMATFCVRVQSPSASARDRAQRMIFRNSGPLSSSRLSLCVS